MFRYKCHPTTVLGKYGNPAIVLLSNFTGNTANYFCRYIIYNTYYEVQAHI